MLEFGVVQKYLDLLDLENSRKLVKMEGAGEQDRRSGPSQQT